MNDRKNIHYVTVRAHPGPKPSHDTYKNVPAHERDDVFSKQELVETCDYMNKMANANTPIPVSIEHTFLDQSLYPDKKVPQLRTGYVASAFINPKDNNCLLTNLAFELDNPYDALALKCIKDGYLKEVSMHHTAYSYRASADKNFDPKKVVFEISLCIKGRRKDTVIFDPDLVSKRSSYAASINTNNTISNNNNTDIINKIYELSLDELSMIQSQIV